MNDLVVQGTEITGPQLWQNISYGMSLQEVMSIVPGAVSNSDAADTLADGSQGLLRLDDYEISSHRYAVHFYFYGNKIVQVTVKTAGSVTDDDFENVVVALRAKYGSELNRNIGGMFATFDWVTSEGANINVTYSREIDCLNINYQARLVQDAAKL